MMKKTLMLLLVISFMGAVAIAQDRNAVVAAYNEGAKAVKTDVKAAVESFEKAITIADQVGESADDLKQKAKQILPGLYFKVAYNNLNEKKPAQEIIQSAKAAIAACDKYDSKSNRANAEKVLVQGYNIMGGEYFAKEEYENALTTFDSLLSVNPDYSNAIFNKSLIYIKQNNPVAVEESIDLFIGKAKAANDEARATQAATTAIEYFRAAGSQAAQADKLDEALSLLDKGSKYGEDKDLCYYYADVYNKKKDFDKGAEYAQKGLGMESGDNEAKAKFYFQLGLAQEGKGQKDDACASFKNSLFGAFADASKAKRTNMKCQ